ncbi:MAG: hypothetical protein ACOC5I_01230, partial [Gemmatimonadota bacterium]
MRLAPWVLASALLLVPAGSAPAQTMVTAGEPGQLEVRPAGEHSVRITLRPIPAGPEALATPI